MGNNFLTRLSNKTDYFQEDIIIQSLKIPYLTEIIMPLIEYNRTILREEKQITFFGAFKAGKSTLLNALLGVKLLPSRANRATGVITKVRYGEAPKAKVTIKRNNIREEKDVFFDEISKYIMLDISDGSSKAFEGAEQIDVEIPLGFLRNNCVLVDTPGLMDNESLTDVSRKEIMNSDLAVLILSADKLLSTTEREEAKSVNELLGGNIVFIINRIDMVDEDEKDEIMEWAREALKGLGNNLIGQPKIFFSAANMTLAAKKNIDNDSYSEYLALLEFENWIKEMFDSEEGGAVIVNSRSKVLKKLLNDFKEKLAVKLTKNQEKLIDLEIKRQQEQRADKNQVIAISQQLRIALGDVRNRLDAFCDTFYKTCAQDIEVTDKCCSSYSSENRKAELKKVLCKYIKEFYANIYNRVNMKVYKYMQAPAFAASKSLEAYVENIEFTQPKQNILNRPITFTKQSNSINLKRYVSDIKVILRDDAQKYIETMDKSLEEYGKNYKHELQTDITINNLNEESNHYERLMEWSMKVLESLNR
jgi:ribosome biogenesis GTPase A